MKFSEDKTKDTLLKAGGLVALYFLADRIDTKRKKRMVEADIATNPAAAQAATIHSLLRPHGAMWLRWLFGIDVDGIMNVAKQIKDLNAVVSAYQKMVGDKEPSLHDDLQLCIGPEPYQKFLSYATQGKTGSWYYSPQSANVPANRWVVTTADANVRRTPVLMSKYSIGNNIVKTVPKRMILGASTGKFAYDETNKILFIEFWTLKKDENKRATYFVAKSQVEFLSKQEFEAREKKEGKFSLQVLEGIFSSSEIPSEEVVTVSHADILDEKFQKVGYATKNTIIGFPLMTLDTGRGKHIQIRTIQGLLRWVRFSDVLIRNRQQ